MSLEDLDKIESQIDSMTVEELIAKLDDMRRRSKVLLHSMPSRNAHKFRKEKERQAYALHRSSLDALHDELAAARQEMKQENERHARTIAIIRDKKGLILKEIEKIIDSVFVPTGDVDENSKKDN